MKHNIRRIFIAGVHKLDIAVYCAVILQRLEYRVLVWDCTAHRELEGCIRKPDKVMDVVHYKDIDFAFGELAVLDEDYDYMLCVWDFGDMLQMKNEKYIFICDGIREHLDALIRQLQRMRMTKQTDNIFLLYRDLYTSYAMEYVSQNCQGFMENMAVRSVEHDCMDEAGYQRFQLYPFTHMGHVSAALEMGIRELLSYAAGLDERELKRGLKLAKRGSAY